jgi:hypothetical protein
VKDESARFDEMGKAFSATMNMPLTCREAQDIAAYINTLAK